MYLLLYLLNFYLYGLEMPVSKEIDVSLLFHYALKWGSCTLYMQLYLSI